MSQRNGDKARFGRERQRKLLRRKLTRELRKALETKHPSPPCAEAPGRSATSQFRAARQASTPMLRILMLEGLDADAELIQYELRKAEIAFISKQVETEQAFLRELGEFSPDLIVSDYEQPGFDGLTALALAKAINPSLPFILVTGSLNDRIRVEGMKAGADDYVMKDNLRPIGPAVERALAEKPVVARLSA